MKRCFEKHNFEELNNIDCGLLYNAIQFYNNKFNQSNNGKDKVFFDISNIFTTDDLIPFDKIIKYNNIK